MQRWITLAQGAVTQKLRRDEIRDFFRVEGVVQFDLSSCSRFRYPEDFDGANVFVEIYTDRIEVSSPGSLPKGLTLADLGRKSIRRNALVADLLHRIGFIEKAGAGIRRSRDEARELDCPEPEFEDDSFETVTFRPKLVGTCGERG